VKKHTQRNKGKNNSSATGYLDRYRHYKKLIKEGAAAASYDKYNVSMSTYSKVINQFNKELADLIIFHAFEFRVPYRLGCIRIKKRLNKLRLDEDGKIDKSRLKINWGASNKLWEEKYGKMTQAEYKEITGKPLVYHDNKHSDRHVYRWYWNKMTCNVPRNTAYSFIPSRANKRAITKIVTSGTKSIDWYL